MALSPMFCRRPSAERTSPLPSSATGALASRTAAGHPKGFDWR
jgi:hypothetical protein